LGFQRIDFGGSLMNGARKDLSRANGMSGSKGRANSYEICIIVDCQARDPQLIENIFEHSHVGISQREGEGSILRIDQREDRRIEHEEGNVPKSLRGRYIDDFHVGRRMLLAAFCTSMAFCSCSTPGMAQVESKTTTSMAENGTSRSEAAVGEKGNIRASRVYDATVLGEPVPVGGEKGRVWRKLLAARVVYLGEAERVPDPDDKVQSCLQFQHLIFNNVPVRTQKFQNALRRITRLRFLEEIFDVRQSKDQLLCLLFEI
jgi:hypothetical protein